MACITTFGSLSANSLIKVGIVFSFLNLPIAETDSRLTSVLSSCLAKLTKVSNKATSSIFARFFIASDLIVLLLLFNRFNNGCLLYPFSNLPNFSNT